MNIKIKLSVVVFLFISVACNSNPPLNQQEKSAIKVVAPQEFSEMSKNQIIIDIRTPDEYHSGYIEGAVNINYFDSDFIEKISKLDKSAPLYLYCRSGNRTSSASAKLAKLGFVEIIDLQGGILNWNSENLQTIKK